MFFLAANLRVPGGLPFSQLQQREKDYFPADSLISNQNLVRKKSLLLDPRSFVKPIKIFTIIGQNNDGENLLAV